MSSLNVPGVGGDMDPDHRFAIRHETCWNCGEDIPEDDGGEIIRLAPDRGWRVVCSDECKSDWKESGGEDALIADLYRSEKGDVAQVEFVRKGDRERVVFTGEVTQIYPIETIDDSSERSCVFVDYDGRKAVINVESASLRIRGRISGIGRLDLFAVIDGSAATVGGDHGG